MNLIWKTNESYLEGTTSKFKFCEKFASFDLDNTLIKPKSKKKFPDGADDWMWNYKNVPERLNELVKDGYCIVIVSNQGGLKENKINEWMTKLTNIVDELKIEIKILASVLKDGYRKPQIKFIKDIFPKVCSVESFYCGDAVGRKGDHSDTDYKFACNAKLSFKTPENLFCGEKNELPKINYPIDFTNPKKFTLNFTPNNKNNEMIIMVGYAGSGKSYISKLLQKKYKYVIINQDTLKTKSKCIKETEKILIENKNSLVIDSTNPSKESRQIFIELAKKYNYYVRIIEMTTTLEQSKHNNFYRALTQNIEHVPDIAYNIYKSKYEKPELTEGVNEIMLQDVGYPDDVNYYQYLF